MARFRPNLVITGLDAHEEDSIDSIEFDGDGGPVRLKLVKPCTRCPIPDVDPATAATAHVVADTLASYRFNPRVNSVTFGMNAIVVEGVDAALCVGMSGRASYAFD